ncbi:hypothetical protein QU24_04800 [Pantoea rodasii]|uniref:Uncharacterized protein n=1 Tax=Pantoea rodasii TaxID=1076549 RepID=A0A0B1RDT1_9GAMM|nr:hypothetical protein [Pantoea rodasii]KHJ69245.1 hypothetical protein QU24_04800 [Pantoea rodasii]
MPVYCFFKKGKHVNALERNDTRGSACLREWGYEKQPEELAAPNAHFAIVRFHDIRNEEQTTDHAFSTGAAFVALIVGLTAVADWLFF